MLRSRLTRAFAVLVLILAQAALALPHHALAQGAMAQAMAAASHEDCQPGAPEHAPLPSHPDTSSQACGCCPGSMPSTQGGGCLDMASCGPGSASPSAPSPTLLPVDAAAEFAPAISAPAAHDFIPEPPPPRA